MEGAKRRARFARRQYHDSGSSFNGATTKVSWKSSPGADHDAAPTYGASMGPRRRCRGEATGVLTTVPLRSVAPQASMGPRPRCRGRGVCDSLMSVARPNSGQLQWGPRRRCRGKSSSGEPSTAPFSENERASMGPRRRCRGRRLSDWPPVPAAVFQNLKLQWGHDEGVVEGVGYTIGRFRPADSGRFNGATTKVSWKAGRRPVALRPVASRRFNGATTKVSWKAQAGRRAGQSAFAEASMGPRRRGRGRLGRRTASRMLSSVVLQWGHDEGVVEGGPPLGRFQDSGLPAIPREGGLGRQGLRATGASVV